jgi:hypothetical protein
MTNKLDLIPLFAWCERDRVGIQTNSAHFNAKPSKVFDDLPLPNCWGVKGRQRFLLLSIPWLAVEPTVSHVWSDAIGRARLTRPLKRERMGRPRVRRKNSRVSDRKKEQATSRATLA